MNVKNCVRCGRIFNYVAGQQMCAQCKTELEILFKDVRLYIRRNPSASIQEVSDECNVESKQIRQWIREERLSFSKDSGVGIECELCGKTIRTGRFCEGCKSNTISELTNATKGMNSAPVEKAPTKKQKGGMHFINKDKR